VIRDAVIARPKGKVLVLFGQLHMSHTHLPGRVASALSQAGINKTQSRVVSGDHQSYFDLVAKGEFNCAAELSDGSYCVYAAAPRTVRKSFIRYLARLGAAFEDLADAIYNAENIDDTRKEEPHKRALKRQVRSFAPQNANIAELWKCLIANRSSL